MLKAASGFLEDEGSFESNSWKICWLEKGQHSIFNLCRYQWELLAAMRVVQPCSSIENLTFEALLTT